MTIRKDTYLKLQQTIKDQRYLINQFEVIVRRRDDEIQTLKRFPDVALKAEAEKILLNKKLRKESMKRWKGGDDD